MTKFLKHVRTLPKGLGLPIMSELFPKVTLDEVDHEQSIEDAKRDAEKMFLCARLIEIQQEDLYAYEHLEYLDQSHEFVPTDETEQSYTIKTTITRDDLTDYLNKYRRQHKLIDKTDKDDHEIAREIAHNNQERSRKLLFKILEQNIERWWD